MWRAIRWRAGSSLMFLAVAVAAVMAAAAGPIYLAAADQSLVTSALSTAGLVETGVTLTPESGVYAPPSKLATAWRSVPGGASAAPGSRFEAPITTLDASLRAFDAEVGLLGTIQLISRTNACSEVHFVAGRCPTSPFGVALSTRSAKALGVHLDSSFQPELSGSGRSSAHGVPRLEVTGLYLAGSPDDPAWWGNNFFPFGGASKTAGPFMDAGFMTAAGVLSLANIAPTTDWAQLPLRVASVPATHVPGVLAALNRWQSAIQTSDGVRVSTQLPSVLAGAESGEHSAQTIVAMISLELFLLVLLVVYAVARATSRLRENDVRVAELRGLPRARIARLALREPGILLLAALPVGVALTYLVLSVIDPHLLGPGATTGVDSLAIEAAVAGCVAGLGSAALGSRGIFAGKRPDEAAEASRQRRARNAAVVDALGLALAAAGVAELVGQHASASVSPIAYLGPGLAALGAGLLAARALPFLARLGARALAWSRRVSLTLATRDLARRQDLPRQVVVPAIATGLLTFAVGALTVSSANHATQAEFDLGAPVVLNVSPRPGVDLVDAVRSADPSGREAMAVARVAASNGTTLMVDPNRFAAIASWPATLSDQSARQVAAELTPPVPPARVVPNARRLAVTVSTASRLSPGPDLQMELFDLRGQGEFDVDFGDLRQGTHVYSTDIDGLCPSGCRLDQVLLGWAKPHSTAQARAELPLATSYRLRLDSIAVAGSSGAGSGSPSQPSSPPPSSPVKAYLDSAASWQSSPAAAVTAGPAGLGVVADLASPSDQATVSPVDVPSVLPAVATSALVALDATPANPNEVQSLGLDESQLTVRAADVVPALPSVGSDATMTNLVFAGRVLQGQEQGVTWQVWCHRPPGAALLRRLRVLGVTVLSTRRSTTVLAGLDRSGPAFGYELYGIAAAGAALLALGAVLFSIASDGRRRRIEFAGLAAVGVPRRTLFGSLAFSSTALAVAGAVTGVAAAIFSASFALGFLPEFPPGRVGPPLAVGIPWSNVLLTGLGAFLLLEIAGLAASGILMRGVRPDLARLSQ